MKIKGIIINGTPTPAQVEEIIQYVDELEAEALKVEPLIQEVMTLRCALHNALNGLDSIQHSATGHENRARLILTTNRVKL